MAWHSEMKDHPQNTEVFEFRQTRLWDGASRRVRSFVVFDSRWSRRRKLLSRLGSYLLRKAVERENLG